MKTRMKWQSKRLSFLAELCVCLPLIGALLLPALAAAQEPTPYQHTDEDRELIRKANERFRRAKGQRPIPETLRERMQDQVGPVKGDTVLPSDASRDQKVESQ